MMTANSNSNSNSNGKIKLFLDVDDTVFMSSIRIIEMLNAKNKTHKTISDLSDWGYRSIDNSITEKDVDSLYEADEFFSGVKVFPDFLKFYQEEQSKGDDSNFEFIFVTKGTPQNLQKKESALKEKLGGNFQFKGLPSIYDGSDCIVEGKKEKLDMKGGIQIDDVTKYMENTNASTKILFRGYDNGKRFLWNDTPKGGSVTGNWYNTETGGWSDVIKILRFFEENREFIAFKK